MLGARLRAYRPDTAKCRLYSHHANRCWLSPACSANTHPISDGLRTALLMRAGTGSVPHIDAILVPAAAPTADSTNSLPSPSATGRQSTSTSLACRQAGRRRRQVPAGTGSVPHIDAILVPAAAPTADSTDSLPSPSATGRQSTSTSPAGRPAGRRRRQVPAGSDRETPRRIQFCDTAECKSALRALSSIPRTDQ